MFDADSILYCGEGQRRQSLCQQEAATNKMRREQPHYEQYTWQRHLVDPLDPTKSEGDDYCAKLWRRSRSCDDMLRCVRSRRPCPPNASCPRDACSHSAQLDSRTTSPGRCCSVRREVESVSGGTLGSFALAAALGTGFDGRLRPPLLQHSLQLHLHVMSTKVQRLIVNELRLRLLRQWNAAGVW